MIYLNEDFTGGSTNFIRDDQELQWDEKEGRYSAEEKKVMEKVKPETGMAIIFNHKILHEGATVKEGLKYILRTEAMYQLVDRTMSQSQEAFHLLIQKAQSLEAASLPFEAVKIYQQASKLDPELAKVWGI
jgi:hypothetical protein